MFSKRKRSSSRKTPSQPQWMTTRSSAARQALLMGLPVEGQAPAPEQGSPSRDPLVPDWSIANAGETFNNGKTPEVHINTEKPLIDSKVIVEFVEAMDMDDEEAEEMAELNPGFLKRLVNDLGEDQGCLPTPLSPSTSAEAPVDNATETASIPQNPSEPQSEANDDSADVRPSMSGMTVTNRSACREVCEGSELDSDLELDDIESASFAGTIGSDIPDYEEELEELTRNAIEAVERAMDEEADRLLRGSSTSYTWEEDFGSFRGVPENFSGPTPGPTKDYATAYDSFTDIWSSDIIDRIVQETNRYAKQTIDSKKASGTLKPSSRLHEWVDTDADEIMVFLAVFMYMGLVSRASPSEYWRENDYLEMPKFKQLLSYNRYILLNKFLHFVDNTDASQCSQLSGGNPFANKVAKLEPVISHLGAKFSSLYNLSKNITLDESLTLFKGRLSCAQAIRSKAATLDVKSYELCDSQTGYLYNFKICTGEESDLPSGDFASKSIAILDLLKGLEGRGHCVTLDNFYNCPAIARYLKSLKFDCLGTLRKNRRNVPEAVDKFGKNVAKGTIIARHCGDVSIVAWKDSKVVTMISTYHNNQTYNSLKAGKPVVKPVCVRDYNNTVRGVALRDQKLSMYLLERRRCVKWYVKVFRRLLNVSVHNAFIMYGSSLRRRDRLPMTQKEFRQELADSLADRHRRRQPQIREESRELLRLRMDLVHVPKYQSGGNNRKRCTVCYQQGNTKMVHTQCVTCGVFLCFGDCWRDWHSLTELERQERGRKRQRT